MTPEQKDARREQIALQIFAAMMSSPKAEVSMGHLIGEKQILTCFELATSFMTVADSFRTPSKRDELPDPQPIIKA